MAEKQRNTLIDLLRYLSIRLLGMALQMFPVDAALAVGRLLGDIIYFIYPRYSQRTLEHLRLAYGPKVSDQWIKKTARDSLRHLGMLVIEVLYAPRLLKINTTFRYIRLKNMDQALHLLVKGGPVIILTGHFGNWEVANHVLAVMGFTSYSVARHLPNRFLNRYVMSTRERTGQRIITKKGATAG